MKGNDDWPFALIALGLITVGVFILLVYLRVI